MDGNTTSDLSEINTLDQLKRFWANRFDNENTRPKYDVQKSEVYKNDPRTKMRGKWNNRIDFAFGCIGSAVGLSNFCTFPARFHENGGLAFLLLYFLMSLLMAMPFFILEFGLGQFTSYSSIMAFKIVPLFAGIGIMQCIIIGILCIRYSIVLSWVYFYISISFKKKLPWLYCNNSFNSLNCKSSFDYFNFSDNYVPSSEEYFYRYVLGYQKLDGTTMDFNELGKPKLHLLASLFVVWFITVSIVLAGNKTISRLFYVTILFPFLFIIILIIFSLTLQGSNKGLIEFMHFNKTKYSEPRIYLEAVYHLIFSLCIASGVLVTYASFNDFHDNFYRDSLIIITVDFLFNILSCIVAFSFVGNISHNTGKRFEIIFRSGVQSLFIIYPDTFAKMSSGHFWYIVLLLMAACLGLTTHITYYHTFITCLLDKYVIFQRSIKHKLIPIISCAIMFYLLSILFITPGGLNWFNALSGYVMTISYLILGLIECLIVGVFYGFLYFRYDLRLMMGYSINVVWLVLFTTLCPLIFTIILIINVPNSIHETVNDKIPPYWCQLLLRLLLFIILSPLFFYMVATLYFNRGYIRTNQYWKKLIEPPVDYGPYYKVNWLKSVDYIKKLLENKDNIEFLSNVSKIENIDEIILTAQIIQRKLLNLEINTLMGKSTENETNIELEMEMKNIEFDSIDEEANVSTTVR